MAYKLFIIIKMRNNSVEDQIQWVLLYMQERSVDIWKKNITEDLRSENLSYAIVGEFLLDLKEEFSGGDDKMIKVTELKKVEQGGKTREEFVQEFRRVVRGSRYKERLLIEEFKRGMNEIIRRKLMEAEKPPRSIEQ